MKRCCEAVTVRGKPCRARPLSGEPFCALHSGKVDPAELGRRGGSRRGKQTAPATELDLRAESIQALGRAITGGNHAAAVAAAKMVLGSEPLDPHRPEPVVDVHADRGVPLDAVLDVLLAAGALTSARLEELAEQERARLLEASEEASKPVASPPPLPSRPSLALVVEPALQSVMEERARRGLDPDPGRTLHEPYDP